MASGSRRLAAGMLALATATGCWTGRLYEAGRVRESLVEYRGASLDGDLLSLEYAVERRGSRGGTGRLALRTVSLPVAALSAGHRVDAFPFVRAPGRPAPLAGEPLPLFVGAAPSGAAPPHAVVALVAPGDGSGDLHLCRRPGEPCLGPFHPEALYRDRTAWWVFPLLPVSAALDVAVFPVYLVTSWPFFLFGD